MKHHAISPRMKPLLDSLFALSWVRNDPPNANIRGCHTEGAKPHINSSFQLWYKMGVGKNHIQASAAGDLVQWCSRITQLAEASGLLPVLKNVKKKKKLRKTFVVQWHKKSPGICHPDGHTRLLLIITWDTRRRFLGKP